MRKFQWIPNAVPGLATAFGILAAAFSAAPSAEAKLMQMEIDPGRSIATLTLNRSGMLSFLGHDHGVLASPKSGAWTQRACLDPENFSSFSYKVSIPVTSLEVDTPTARASAGLTSSAPSEGTAKTIREKMLGAEVLDAEKFPQMQLTITSLKKTGDYYFSASGTLEIHGMTKPFEVNGVNTLAENKIYRFVGDVPMKLSEFGIAPPTSMGGTIKVVDDTKLHFDVTFTRKDTECAP